jgi:hypothetical protein
VTGLFLGIKGKSPSQWVHEFLLVWLFPEALTFGVVFVDFSVFWARYWGEYHATSIFYHAPSTDSFKKFF